jgi:hypothetical protein
LKVFYDTKDRPTNALEGEGELNPEEIEGEAEVQGEGEAGAPTQEEVGGEKREEEEGEGEVLYEVERVVACRKEKGVRKYKIKWKGCSLKHAT